MNYYEIASEAVKVLEEKLQEKLYEFDQATNEGKPQSQLNAIYQEIKDITHQIDFAQPYLRQAAG